ncbi:MAG: LysM domain-containing protein [Cyanobacteria bacterium SIG32]|nr:LysM domain-containing protein [Cyanobacteria bacterium SIG32]
MAVTIEGTYDEIAIQGETFDMLAYRIYTEERMSKYLRYYNPQYSDVIKFQGGEQIKVPIVTAVESVESLAPWRR